MSLFFILYITSVLWYLVVSSPPCIPKVELVQGGNTIFQCTACSSSVQWYKDGDLVVEKDLEEAVIQGNRVSFTGTRNLSHEANWTCSEGHLFSGDLPYFGELP